MENKEKKIVKRDVERNKGKKISLVNIMRYYV